MSAPRYIIQLKVGDMTVSRKLKTVLGDTEGLQHEIALILQEDGFKSLADTLANKYGGLEAAQQKYHNDQLWYCDACGNQYPKTDFITVKTDNLAGIVLCPDCK